MPIRREPVSEDLLHESLHALHMCRHFVILEAMDIEGKVGGGRLMAWDSTFTYWGKMENCALRLGMFTSVCEF